MKAILIARVSTEEQKEAGNSLPAQIERLKKYCERKNLEILRICSFDESAYKNQRNEFDFIINFILNQKEKVAVCVIKLTDFRVTFLIKEFLCSTKKRSTTNLNYILFPTDKL